MPTLQKTTLLSKPRDDEVIPSNAFAYLRTRTRLRLFDLVIKNFKASGISQAVLAKRMGKGTDRICKLLGSPGNWTVDTATDLLFAIDGCVLEPKGSYPLDKPIRNDTVPHYLEKEMPTSKTFAVGATIIKAPIKAPLATANNTVVMELAQ